MMYREWHGLCLFSHGGQFPPDAREAAQPFSPLVILENRPAKDSGGLRFIRSARELGEPDGLARLMPCRADAPVLPPEVRALIEKDGAIVLNTAFTRAFSVLSAQLARKKSGLRVNLVGLGDVGSTVLTGLKLLGGGCIDTIGIFDPYEPLMARYVMELGQVLPLHDGEPLPEVSVCREPDLFHCDVLIFTASRGVPAVGSNVQDVRMAQFAKNREMLRAYARRAREENFCGLFCQVSDPVDPLARALFLDSNCGKDGNYDFAGLLPEQVRGFGLGVMQARAAYAAKRLGADFTRGRAFGPHGEGLVVCNAPNDGYDAALSIALTEQARTLNLQVRELGFKPYIAPGLSSAAVSILRMLRGDWFESAVALGGCYFGCRSRLCGAAAETYREALAPALAARLEASYAALRELRYE